MNPLQKVFFCHTGQQTLSLTKITKLKYSALCTFVFWCLSGISLFMAFQNGLKNDLKFAEQRAC